MRRISLCGGIRRCILKQSKGKFVLNKDGVKALLQSQTCLEIARKEAEKKGEVTEDFIGTQRAWAKGKEAK